MTGIQIKIGGKWAYLPDDFSLSLEQTSPIFNDQGTFSFPFEIPLEPNREILQNIADPYGDISLKDIDKLPAEIWFMGVMLYRGKIETDSEIEFEDTIPLTFISGNSDFMDRTEEINARDVPLDRQIKLGYLVTEAHYNFEGEDKVIQLPEHVMMNYTEYNVSDPYPVKPYCNVRVCASDENITDGSSMYVILEARRPFSGVCFYVRYFLQCLFTYMNVAVREDTLGSMEDIERLAFFTTKCDVDYGKELYPIPYSDISSENFLGSDFAMEGAAKGIYKTFYFAAWDFTYKGKDIYATNKNFPDCTAKEIIEYLQTAFGVVFVYDARENAMRMYYIKDILKSEEILSLDVEILDCTVKKSKFEGLKITYGNTDDTAFNYTDYQNAVEYEDYKAILVKGISANDTTCFIDKKTGNAYRIKVNKDTGGDPSLFEVAGYRDYQTPEASDEPEEQTLTFQPVIVNDVQKAVLEKLGNSTDNSENEKQCYAIFADVQLNKSQDFRQDLYKGKWYGEIYQGIKTPYSVLLTLKARCQENYDMTSSNEAPLRTYDAGQCVGIMRGPGNEAGTTYINNYDGEGNDSWVQTVANYAFTSDSCDNYGRFFDYNGTESGGVDQEGRFSLKLIANKDDYPIGAQYSGRGLVSKFLSEYLYFMGNKKAVILTVKMTISQILGIDMLKRYQIGDYVGFINKLSYTIDRSGITDVKIELYTI